jgi:hypothetical protein
MKRHSQEVMQVVRGALAEAAALPMEQAVRTLVTAAIEAHRIDPKLHRVLAEQMPRTVDLGLAAFVCVTSIEALTHTAVVHHSDSLSDEAFGALVDEATRLIVRYLQ